MNTKIKIARTTAGLALAAFVLTGCVVVDDGPMRESPATGAPAETPEPASDETAAPSDDGAESPASAPSDGGSTVAPKPETAKVDLAPDEEGSTQYVYAHQAFSPELEVWTVNADRSELHYQRFSCIGSVKADSYGAMTADEDDEEGHRYDVVWSSGSPMEGYDEPSTQMIVTDKNVVTRMDASSGAGGATVHTDSALSEYGGMCTAAGETLADFALAAAS